MKKELTVDNLKREAGTFANAQSIHADSQLYGVTDGKAVGTYLEHRFRTYLATLYDYDEGISARGIDFPQLSVDMKVTSIRQPQSLSPFRSARQKVFGLGYGLLLFVYNKTDNHTDQTATLSIMHVLFVESHRTGDFQTTRGLRQIVENDGNVDDIVAFLLERNLPVDEIVAVEIAKEVLKQPPDQGYLTISNALQWRLQYRRVIEQAGQIDGVIRLG